MVKIPAITTEQMREVDRLMVEEYGIELTQMMENAGRALAESGREMLGGEVAGKRIAVLCGVGNNGGGGMVAARRLHGWGARVQVILAGDEQKLKAVPARQWAILRRLDLHIGEVELNEQELIVDAMLGYGAVGDPRPPISDWIERANAAQVPILALDAPSGLDTTNGQPGKPTVRAARTLTLALPKTGLLEDAAADFVGELYLADIGVPPELYRQESLGLNVGDLFSSQTILRIRD